MPPWSGKRQRATVGSAWATRNSLNEVLNGLRLDVSVISALVVVFRVVRERMWHFQNTRDDRRRSSTSADRDTVSGEDTTATSPLDALTVYYAIQMRKKRSGALGEAPSRSHWESNPDYRNESG